MQQRLPTSFLVAMKLESGAIHFSLFGVHRLDCSVTPSTHDKHMFKPGGTPWETISDRKRSSASSVYRERRCIIPISSGPTKIKGCAFNPSIRTKIRTPAVGPKHVVGADLRARHDHRTPQLLPANTCLAEVWCLYISKFLYYYSL